MELKSWEDEIIIESQLGYQPEKIIATILGIIILLVFIFTPVKIWGHKSIAIFDWWSFAHTMSGATIAFTIIKLRKRGLHHPLLFLFLWFFIWETTEHYLELGAIPIPNKEVVVKWFDGQELWANRIISDPFCGLIGYVLLKRNVIWVYPITVFAYFCFLAIHIILGNSMIFHNF